MAGITFTLDVDPSGLGAGLQAGLAQLAGFQSAFASIMAAMKATPLMLGAGAGATAGFATAGKELGAFSGEVRSLAAAGASLNVLPNTFQRMRSEIASLGRGGGGLQLMDKVIEGEFRKVSSGGGLGQMFSGLFSSMRGAGTQAASFFGNAFSGAMRGGGVLGAMVSRQISGLGTLGTLGGRAFGALGTALQPLQGALGGVGRMLGVFIPGQMMALVGSLALGTAAITGLHHALQEAGDMESFVTSFKVLTGSGGQAREMTAQLQQMSAATHLSMDQLARAGQELLAFGTDSGQVVDYLKQIGDASGGNKDRFAGLALAFSETASAGQLMGHHLLQFINAGFNPLLEISQRTGRSMLDLRKDMEGGKVSFDMVADSLKHATSEGGRFFGFTEAQAKTWNGQIAMLQNRVGALFREFGTPLIDSLRPMLEDAVGMATNLAGTAKEWGTAASQAIGAMRGLFASGELSQVVSLSLKVGFGEAVNYGDALLNGLAESFGIVLAGDIKGALILLQEATKLQFWQGLGNVLGGVLMEVVAKFERAIAGAMESLGDAPGMGWLKDRAGVVRHQADLDEGSARTGFDKAGLQLAPAMAAFMANTKTALAEAAEAMGRNLANAPELVPVAENLAELRKVLEKALPKIMPPMPDEEHEGKVMPLAGVSSAITQKFEPLSDRLSKIGLFIGGSGGPQRAAEQTAANTKRTNEILIKMGENQPAPLILGQFVSPQ